MERSYKIGDLARAGGVPASTVRFYERSGLLKPDSRSEGNYRLYGQAALERLRFIRAAQANGFTLEDVAALLDFRDGKTAPCKAVQDLIQTRLADLDKRVEQMRELQSVLRASLKTCRTAERSGRCEVLENLKAASSKPSSPPHKGHARKSRNSP